MDYDAFRSKESQQWDAEAANYEARRAANPIYAVCVDATARALDARRGDSILDAGCGTGLVTRTYARPGIDITAFDLSQASLDSLARHVAATFVQGDITAMPFADGQFDKVLCANTLQHLPTPALREGAIAELARVSRGKVIVTAHNYSVFKRRAGWIKEGKPGQAGVQYIYRFESEELRAMLERHLVVDRLVGIGLPLPYRLKLASLSRIAERMLSRFSASARYGHMLLAVCHNC